MEEKERMAKVEGILEEVRARLNHSLRNRLGEEISSLRREIYNNFRWTMGIMISMWVTIILAIIFTR
jgi:hypothetical protein